MAPTGRKSTLPARGKKEKILDAQDHEQNDEPQSSEPNAVADAAINFEIPELKRSQIPAATAKYLDESLPPMECLEDIFRDIANKAMHLGFADVLRQLGNRPLRVATVCSGTESPLLALEMIKKGLSTTPWQFQILHVFSCEIVAFKQAYIERNFNPPTLFRDLLELAGSEARTAYGSPATIPGNLDIMIAGTACVDFSLLNDKRKTLAELGESGSTFYALLRHAERYRPRIIILENVRAAPWNELIQIWSQIDYAATFFALDSKRYYIPQTRQRGYMVCVDKRCLNNGAGGESLSPKLGMLISQFARQASSPAGKFLLSEDDLQLEQIERDYSTRLESSSLRNRISWDRYQTRHEQHRIVTRVGAKRPISWSQPGAVVCQPPDHFQRKWFKAQVERIWDTLDIKCLIDMAKGVDMISKERFVDLSQGVDRGHEGEKNFGVAGCLTPCGIPFVTSRGRPITGLESIGLQGLPKDRLILTRESQRELQDLAGNAMTSTVVCAVTLAALIAHHDVLDKSEDSTEMQMDADQTAPFALKEHETHLSTVKIEESSSQSINRDELQLSAHRSARYCVCEKQSGVKNNLLQCFQCGHTACRSCAGNPAHLYQPLVLDRKQPLEFFAELKRMLPMRLTFDGLSEEAFSEYRSLFPGDSKTRPSVEFIKFTDVVRAAFSDEARFSEITRAERWTVVYEGEHCSLHLTISHDACRWFVFGKPPRTSPARCLLREILAKPIARITATSKYLLDGEWEICAPLSVGFWLEISGRGVQMQSYQARWGLQQAEHATSTVWTQIQINAGDEDILLLGVDVRGTYDYLPECGTALGSLYRKPATESSPPVFLFFDPSKYGDLQHDSCVLSLEHHRISGYAPRMTIGELSPSWRALDVKEEPSRVRTFTRPWKKVSNAGLRLVKAEQVIYRSLSAETLVSVGDRDCHDSFITLVSLEAPASILNLSGQPSPWQARGPGRSDELKDLAWAVQKVAAVAGFLNWRPVSVAGSLVRDAESICDICQPAPPKILWGRDRKGRIVPYEDPKGAATYERAIKSKPPPFLVLSRIGEDGLGELRFALNIQGLAHQAIARLVESEISENARFSWRLVPNAYDSGRKQPARMTLRGNRDNIPSVQPPHFQLTLREEQLRSLTWMIAQEAEYIAPFMEQETEEAALPLMSWRAEARAEMPKIIRGGVLADEVGYGKTAIVLGLIDAQSEKDRTFLNAQPEDPGFIATHATLIVVPGNVFGQWDLEIERFLGKGTYKVVKIKDASQLAKATVARIQDADIVLVSWGLLKTDAYYQALRHFTGTPRAPTSGTRNFDNWFADTQRALRQLVPVLKDEGPDAFLQEVLRRRRELKETKAQSTYVPSQRLRGEAFALAQQQKVATRDASVVSEAPSHDSGIQRTASPESQICDDSLTESSVEESDDESLQKQTGKRKRTKQEAQPGEVTSGKAPKHAAKKIWNYRQKLNIDKGAGSGMEDMRYPPLHAFRFNRLVVDEFMHAEELRQTALLAFSARSKWILSGTPALNEFADIKTMAGYLGVHLGIDDDCDAPTNNQRLKRIRRHLTAVEAFQIFQPPRSSAWYDERRNQAQRFLDRFVRQNSPNIDFIPLTNHVILTKQLPGEKDTYEKLYAHLQRQQGSAHRIRNPFDDPLLCRLNKFLGDQHELPAHVALVKSAVTADLRDFAWDVDDCRKRLGTHKELLAECWAKLSVLATQMVHSWHQWSVDAGIWKSFLDDLFAHVFGDQAVIDEVRLYVKKIVEAYRSWEETEETAEVEEQVAERFTKAKPSKAVLGAVNALAEARDGESVSEEAEDPAEELARASVRAVSDVGSCEDELEIEERAGGAESLQSEEHPGIEEPSEDDPSTDRPRKRAKKRDTKMESKKGAVKPAKLHGTVTKEKTEANRRVKEKLVRKKLLEEMVAAVRKTVQASRDIRFFTAMQDIQTAMEYHCQGCARYYGDKACVVVVRSCGHLLCEGCVSASAAEVTSADSPAGSVKKSTCRVSGCDGSAESSMLVPGRNWGDSNAASESAKLTAMNNVIQQTPGDELVLLFVQFMDLISAASRALKSAKIEHRVVKTGRDSDMIAEFIASPSSEAEAGEGDGQQETKRRSRPRSKANSMWKSTSKTKVKINSTAKKTCTPETDEENTLDNADRNKPKGPRPKVLILPVGTSMAAGLNLQAINHVIFLSPLVLPEQSEWDSGMTQAIGRVRRYGQKRPVHVYHLLSENTADVTILKEREESRTDEGTRRTLVWRDGTPRLVGLNELQEGDTPIEGPSLTFEQDIAFGEKVEGTVDEALE